MTQTYLITGANRGLGLEMTRQCLAMGHHVVATCRDPSAATELLALNGQLDIHALDVALKVDVAHFAEQLKVPSIDVLINNAGYMAERQSVDEMDFAQWEASFTVNTIAPWQLSVALLPKLSKSTNAKVVTLTSQMGSLQRAGFDRVAYRSSKAAANMAMRTLALEWQKRGIVVCMLHPGWVRTDMGGGNAALGVVESSEGMLSVVDQLTMANTGEFLDYAGDQIPW